MARLDEIDSQLIPLDNLEENYRDFRRMQSYLHTQNRRLGSLGTVGPFSHALRVLEEEFLRSAQPRAPHSTCVELASSMFNATDEQLSMYSKYMLQAYSKHKRLFFYSVVMFNVDQSLLIKNNKRLNVKVRDIYTEHQLRSHKPLFEFENVVNASWYQMVSDKGSFVGNNTSEAFLYYITHSMIESLQLAILALDPEYGEMFKIKLVGVMHTYKVETITDSEGIEQRYAKEYFPHVSIAVYNPARLRLPYAALVGLGPRYIEGATYAELIENMAYPPMLDDRKQVLNTTMNFVPRSRNRTDIRLINRMTPYEFVSMDCEVFRVDINRLIREADEFQDEGFYTPFATLSSDKSHFYATWLPEIYKYQVEGALSLLYETHKYFTLSISRIIEVIIRRRFYLGYQLLYFLFIKQQPTEFQLDLQQKIRLLFIEREWREPYALAQLAGVGDLANFPLNEVTNRTAFDLVEQYSEILEKDCAFLTLLPLGLCETFRFMYDIIQRAEYRHVQKYPRYVRNFIKAIESIVFYPEDEYENNCRYPDHNEFAYNLTRSYWLLLYDNVTEYYEYLDQL